MATQLLTWSAEEEAIHAEAMRPYLVRQAVASCLKCGGKYRPAGGECIHEHPAPGRTVSRCGQLGHWGGEGPHAPECPLRRYLEICGLCHYEWRPGHTCIRQPTAKEIAELAEYSALLRRMDEVIELLSEELGLAKPAAWEVM